MAEAARTEAVRARRESVELRMNLRRQVREFERRRAACLKTMEVSRICAARPIFTGWSKLPWRTARDIDDVLELVDR